MPNQARQCGYCANNSYNSPNVVIFTASAEMKKALNHPKDLSLLICEEHFDKSDVKYHGNSKRLISGAIPKSFPKREAVAFDHRYLPTRSFCLVSLSDLLRLTFQVYLDPKQWGKSRTYHHLSQPW